jgi:hypothetical protein
MIYPPDLVLVQCSRGKNDVVGPARKVYRGPHFFGGLKYARSSQARRVLIVSAKHGLIHPDRVIAPYNQLMGEPGCVTVDELREQAAALGVLDLPNVHAAVSVNYATPVKAVWPHVYNVLEGIEGWYERVSAYRQASEAALAALAARE